MTTVKKMGKNQISKTAAFIAVKFYGLTRIDRYRSVFDEPVVKFYDELVQFLPAPFCWYHNWLDYNWIRSMFIRCEEFLLPGDLMHIIARKWYIQQLTRKLLDQKYEQLIILGAGFDHLGLYFAQKDIPCFELETPGMARIKHRFLKKTYRGTKHPTIVEANMMERDLENLLRQHPQISPSKKTVIVAEGFFDYLPYHKVSSIFITVKNYFSHRSAIVSTHFSLDELPKRHRKVYQNSITMVGEKLRFKTSFPELKKLLFSLGYNICQSFDSQHISKDLHLKINTSMPVLKGFYILQIKQGH